MNKPHQIQKPKKPKNQKTMSKVITGKVIVRHARLSFNDLWKAKKIGTSPDPKFSATVICEESTTLMVEVYNDETGERKKIEKPHSFMKTVAEERYKEKFGKLDAVFPNWCYNPADGSGTRKKFVDKKTGEYRPGVDDDTWLVDAKIKESHAEDGKVEILDKTGKPMPKNDKRLYSGCYVSLLIDVYAYDDPNSGKIVSARLNGVIWKKDGEPFVGGPQVSAKDEFADEFEDEDIDDEEDTDADW